MRRRWILLRVLDALDSPEAWLVYLTITLGACVLAVTRGCGK